MTRRPCDHCASPYEAVRPSSRFCSTACRQRAARSRRNGADPPGAAEQPAHSELVAAVERELAVLGVCGSAAAVTAVELARSLAAASTSPSARASLARELRATLALAAAGRRPSSSSALRRAQDELAARRARRAINAAAREPGS